VVLAGLFAVGLLLAMLAPPGAVPSVATLAAACYRAGALVFGGGHVVLPLLEQALVRPGWLQADAFLAGYGAAQAVPGPMFSLAAYLGAALPLEVSPALGGLVALVALFLPGFLLLAAVLPLWTRLVRHPRAARAIAGANAAVVALLAAAFLDPVLREGVRSPLDAGIAVVGFVLLAQARVPAWGIVAWCVAASVLAGLR
jgi:chromate transporter